MKATWNGAVLAQSDDTIVIEGNHYFPAASIVAIAVVLKPRPRPSMLRG